MTDFFTKNVTIFNDIDATEDKPRRFVKNVISKCQISGQIVEKNAEMTRNIVNAKTVISKDVKRYKYPIEYMSLPEELQEGFYTVQVGDIVVFGLVEDEVTNANEFASLLSKYEGNCIKVTSVNANIYGMPIDNISMSNV